MKTCKKFFSLFLALVMLAVFPSYTESLCIRGLVQPRLSLPYHWAETPRTITFDISSLPSNYANAAMAAMNVWNRVKDPLTKKSQVTLKLEPKEPEQGNSKLLCDLSVTR